MQGYSTHPSHQQRLQLLNHYIDSIAQTPHSFGNHYLIDSSTFSRLQSAARYERLRQSLNRNALLSCIEYAFLKHLSFPTNPYYQYFLLEGLRRYMLLYPADTQKKFILNNYNLAQYDSSYLSHTKTGPQLADYLNFLELEISQNLSIPPSLQQSPSTDSLFPTYPDVFEYLVQQGIVQQYPESHLTLGLYYDPGNRYLSKYLSFDSIKYPSYAQHLLNNSSPPSTDSPLLVVYGLEKLELYETNRYNPEFPASSTKDIYKIALTDAGESLNKQLYYVPQRRNNLAHYLHMHDLHQTIEQLPTNENFSFSLPRLKPALWSTFQNYHTSTIEFLNVRLIHDIRKDFNLFSCNTYCFAFCGSPLHRKDDTYLKMKWQAATITDSLTISNHAIYEEEIDKVNYKSLYSGTRSFLKEHSIE